MKKLSFNPKPLKGLLMLLTILFVMPQSALAQTKYKIETDGNCEVYYYENFDRIVVTEAEAGKKLAIWLKEDANPGSGKYFTGEFTLNGSSLGSTEWGYNEGFTMPAEAVMIKALQADKQTLSVDLTTTTRQEVPPAAALLFNGDGRLNYNDKLGGYDVDKSGVADMVYTTSEDGKHMYVQRLAGADAMGTYTLDYSSWNTAMYGSISFVFSHTAKTVLASWISLSAESFTYTGQAIEPQVTVTDCGTDVTEYFDVTYQNNVLAGESTDAQAPTVTVKAKDTQTGYLGSAQQTFTIEPRVTTGGSRIAVIADPHVMPASLLTNPSNTDWTTYLAGSRKLVDYSQTLFDQAVATLKSDKPELVLIVGDLTKDGEQASHNYLKGKLDELKAAGIPTLVIPGNHDLGSSDAKIYGATTTAAPTISQSGFAQLYQDYGYGSTSERESTTSLTYACEPIKGLVVIGIDSGEEGQLPTATLTWVCDKAVTARAAGKQVIAMMHHPLIPHITGGEAFVSTVSVADYATVRNSLADAGISVVFTGHFHTSDIARDWNGDKSLPIYDVTTGSLCSYPCDYRVVTLNDALTQLQIDTRSITSAGAPLGGGDNFTTAIAKTRLTTSMTNILTPRLTAKLVASGTSELAATLAVGMIAPSLVDTYIYHAEGDEHKNSDAQTLLSGLNQLLESYPAYKTMANSMLEDKSNYGTDRVDQTNDRSLSVSIEMVVKAVQSEWITLDGGPFTYTGQAIKPTVKVTDGGTDVTSCFDVEYSNNTNAGAGTDATAPTVTVKAKSGQVKYQGSVTKTFTITPKPVTVKSGLAASEVTDNGVTTYSVDASNATITGALNDEKLTIKGVEAMAIAGNKKEVTLNYTKATLMLGENQASNYVLAQAGNQATAAITRSTIKEPVDWDKEKNTINGIEYNKFNKETLSKILNTNGEIEPSMFSDHNNVTFVQEITEDADGHETVKYSLIFGESKELTHVTVMGAEVGMSCLCVGNDFVGSATEGLALASNVGPDGVSSFAQMGGGSMRQETGARAMVRGADDEMKIEWGVEYLILKDCDLEFILHTEKGPITIESITFRRPGDANGDDKVNAVDLVEMINAKNGKASERFNLTNADIDRDGDITQTDIDFVVKLIMGTFAEEE
jgi:3',5'-cyclic AMP phosphodiesterase CpdA